MQDNFNVDNPVFVMGTGRCGLSPLMDLIAYHKAFAWPSQYNNRFPKNYKVSFFSRLVDLPLIHSSRLKYKKFPIHFEAFSMWNNIFYGFRRPFRDLGADDVTPFVKSKFRDAVRNIMRYQGKKRFIAEYSGWSRMGFMKAIFPEAKFIHVVRDGRAVANSLTNVSWWLGWEGIYKWRWGVPPQDLLEKLEKYNYSFLALAAVHWKLLINNIVEQSKLLPPEDILVVRYEDLVKDPYQEAYRCIEFCSLAKDCQKFKKHLATVKIVNANQQKFRIPAWRENMSQKQIDMLDDLLEEELVYFNYLEPHFSHDQQGVWQERVIDRVTV
jgi:hypothetical protein